MIDQSMPVRFMLAPRARRKVDGGDGKNRPTMRPLCRCDCSPQQRSARHTLAICESDFQRSRKLLSFWLGGCRAFVDIRRGRTLWAGFETAAGQAGPKRIGLFGREGHLRLKAVVQPHVSHEGFAQLLSRGTFFKIALNVDG